MTKPENSTLRRSKEWAQTSVYTYQRARRLRGTVRIVLIAGRKAQSWELIDAKVAGGADRQEVAGDRPRQQLAGF